MGKQYFQKIFKKKQSKIKIAFKILAGIILVGVLVGIIVFASFFVDLPRPEKFNEGMISQSTKIYDRTGTILLYEIAGAEKRTSIPLNEIPNQLKEAVITAEDRNFYQHKGIELKSILRAIFYDLKLGQPAQGGSTISQQLVRSYFLTKNKTIKRKTREIILTIEMERRYSKDQILEWYLNIIPFGSNIYGVQAASEAYFGKPVEKLSLAESAVLAGLIRSPSRLSPYGENQEELLGIKDYILESMVGEKYITEEQALRAQKEKIVFVDTIQSIKAPHFSMYVKNYLEKKYGVEYVEKSGLKVITTIDMSLQQYGQDLIKKKMEELKIYDAHNAALASVNPKTGEVLAMIGSKDFFGESSPAGCNPGVNCEFDPQVNVTLSERQPGSAFKPFAYAEAFKNELTPETLIWDVKTEFNPYCQPDSSQTKDQYNLDCYHPRNYDGSFKGLISLRSALAQSRNLPAVKILYIAGLKETLEIAKSMGITSLRNEKNYGLALVLGGGEVKPLEMALAYGIFANDGIKAPLHFIKEIKDSAGKTIESEKQGEVRVLSAQTARQINSILSDNEARAPLFGWNSPLFIPEFETAVKTGTTQNNKDAWAIGYTPGISTAVWVGNNNSSPTQKEGSYLAAPIWRDFMLHALPKIKTEAFIKPETETASNRKPMINGIAPEEPHSILYYIDKNDPLGNGNSQNDIQFPNWEWAVQNWTLNN